MRPDWDTTWMSVADSIAKRSACSVRQVGAVVVSADNSAHWVGYNGPPSGYTEALRLVKVEGCASYCPQGSGQPGSSRASQDQACVAIHAEINALIKSDPVQRRGGTAYSTAAPCWKCSLAIANSGVSRLVCRDWEFDRSALAYDVRRLYSTLKIEIVGL